MSYKECLIFIAYVKYLRTSIVPHNIGDKQVASLANPSDAAKDESCKPHRIPPPSRRRQKPKFTLQELLSQMSDHDLFCEVVKSEKLKPHRTPPPPRRRQKPKFTLQELLNQTSDDNRQGEIDTGPPVGNEVW